MSLAEVNASVVKSLDEIASRTKLTHSAITKIAIESLDPRDQHRAFFTRKWSKDAKSADYWICGFSFTIRELDNGTFSCSPITCTTYFQDGTANVRASMKERAESAKGLPKDHDTALRNAITRINGAIRNILDDNENTKEATARKSNAHAIKQSQAIEDAKIEAQKKDEEIAELRKQVEALINAQKKTG